jgi:hypothetical protein
MDRMAQSLVGGLHKAFALGRVSMDGCGDVLETRAHLEATGCARPDHRPDERRAGGRGSRTHADRSRIKGGRRSALSGVDRPDRSRRSTGLDQHAGCARALAESAMARKETRHGAGVARPLRAKSGRHALLHRGKRMLSSALQVRWHSVESAANELAKSQACCDDENGTLRRGVLGRARGVIAKA